MRIIEFVAGKSNVGISHIYRSEHGSNGATWIKGRMPVMLLDAYRKRKQAA